MKYDAVVFDLDGTLIDTLEDLMDSVNYALAEIGFPARTYEEIRTFVGNGVRRLVYLSVPERTPDDVSEKCLMCSRRIICTIPATKPSPNKGTPRAAESKFLRRALRLRWLPTRCRTPPWISSEAFSATASMLSSVRSTAWRRSPSRTRLACARQARREP